MAVGFHPRKQGDVGEAHAIGALTELGADVSLPLFHCANYDLLADFGTHPLRVQVKTSRVRAGERYSICLATSGGNQSWNRIAKYFDRSRCDLLFVLVADRRRWLIPASAVDGSVGIKLGGPKYSEFQLDESGRLPPALERCLQSASPWGSSGDGESGVAVNHMPLAEWVRIPPPPPTARTPAPQKVGVRVSSIGRSRMSPGHQMTVPIGPFRAAGLSPGDQFEVIAEGPGEIRVSRVHAAEPDSALTTPEATGPAASA